jgi:hypothetical protein
VKADAAPCMDCGTDTTPCTGRRGCRHIGRWEWYMIWPALWATAVGPDAEGFLCIGCLETRLGRRLLATDFTDAPINRPTPWNTPRLAAALDRRPPVRQRGFRAVVITRPNESTPEVETEMRKGTAS